MIRKTLFGLVVGGLMVLGSAVNVQAQHPWPRHHQGYRPVYVPVPVPSYRYDAFYGAHCRPGFGPGFGYSNFNYGFSNYGFGYPGYRSSYFGNYYGTGFGGYGVGGFPRYGAYGVGGGPGVSVWIGR
jgi:hypothetical protein